MTDPTLMPTMVLEEFLKEHKHTSDPREAHPIDEDILHSVCDTKHGPILIEYDLAAIQAVAIREILPYDCETEVWLAHENGKHYYQAQSVTFYDLLSMVHQRYDHYIEVEHVEDLVEVHTRQFLRDMHGYEGDFSECEPTLCNAMNQNTYIRKHEPENAHYAFTDARGIVIQDDTHPEGDDEHDIETLVAALERTEMRPELGDDWTQEHAVQHLTSNYLATEDLAREAHRQYVEA